MNNDNINSALDALKLALTEDGTIASNSSIRFTDRISGKGILWAGRDYTKQFSYREVANWLTKNSGRTISHVGLLKRLKNERQRKNKATSLRRWADYAQKAIQKAEDYEEKRTGAKESTSETTTD